MMRPNDLRTVIHKQLREANQIIRSNKHSDTEFLAIFDKPSVEFCANLIRRVPKEDHGNVIKEVIRHIISHNPQIAHPSKPQEVTIENPKFKIKMESNMLNKPTRFDEIGGRQRALILVDVIVPEHAALRKQESKPAHFAKPTPKPPPTNTVVTVKKKRDIVK